MMTPVRRRAVGYASESMPGSQTELKIRRWPLYLVAAGALGLVAARMIWPLLLFDNTSLVLFGLAAIALLVAYLPIKRIKWGEFEAELDRAVDHLERKVAASEAAPPVAAAARPPADVPGPSRSTPTWQRFFDEYISLMNSPASNVEKIVAAAIMLERMVETAAESLTPEQTGRARGTRGMINEFAEHGLISDEERSAFLEFWSIRNRVVHEGIQPTDEQTARLLDLVWRLMRTLA